MTAPLSANDRRALNNLGFFPPNGPFPFGDVMAELLGTAPSVSVAPTTIWYGSVGNDGTGTGTAANPFATPGRASDAIPDGAEGVYIIEALDTGPFPLPSRPKARAGSLGLTIEYVGSRQDVRATFAGNPPVLTPVASSVAQFTMASGGFTDVVTDRSHWIDDNSNFVFGVTLFPIRVRASTTPTVVVVPPFGAAFGVCTMYRLTTFEYANPVVTDNPQATPAVVGAPGVTVRFVGILFDNQSTSFILTEFRVVETAACAMSTSPGSDTATCFDCGEIDLAADNLAVVDMENGGVISGVYGVLALRSGFAVFLGPVVLGPGETSTPIFSIDGGYVFGGLIDFARSATACIGCTGVGNGTFEQVDAIRIVTGTVAHFLLYPDGSRSVYRRSSGTVTGTVTGAGWRFLGANIGIGISAAGSGTLTSATAVEVGGRGTFAYATLPKNDFTLDTGRGTIVRS